MCRDILQRLSAIIACSLAVGLSCPAFADIAVIVNRNNPVNQMTVRMVSDLYLGRLRTFDGGDACIVLEHPPESTLRERFFANINGMNLRQLNAYWARLRFSGQTLPPVSLTDSKSVLEMVRRERLAIGYVDAQLVDQTVQVVLRIKE